MEGGGFAFLCILKLIDLKISSAPSLENGQSTCQDFTSDIIQADAK